MEYLLDTATFAANALTPGQLPAKIRKLLNTDASKAVCGVSLLELAIHYRRGRLGLTDSLEDFFDAALAADIRLLEITPAIAVATAEIPDEFPGDPFDRAIASTARVLDLTLITPDRQIRDSGFCRVEFYPFKHRG